MTEIRLATWNINSVRLRADQVVRFLGANAPDILCLQETKCPDELFPADAFRELGYVHQAINGQKATEALADAIDLEENGHLPFSSRPRMRLSQGQTPSGRSVMMIIKVRP